MFRSLKKILIPVDFSENTEVAIAKTLALLQREEAEIHLLHILRWSPFLKSAATSDACRQKLEEWKKSIEECYEEITVYYALKQHSSIQRTIRRTAEELKADLVVIGQSAMHSGYCLSGAVSPMHLAKTTNIPVLTVKPGSLRNKTKTVVVPVGDNFPESKMHALEVLCRNVKLNVHLITTIGDANTPSDFSAYTLLRMYQQLKARLHCPVEYAVVHGVNKAKAILGYAQKMDADILLVQPETETKIGWWNRHISDVLPRGSKMQVLAVGATH